MALTRRTVLTAAGLLPVANRAAFAQPAAVSVRIATSPNDDLSAVLYAQQSGMFRGAGIDLTISGDLVAVPGAEPLLYLTAIGDPKGDQIVVADPKTGKAIKVLSKTTTLDLLGVGQWAGTGYAFSAAGQAFAFDLAEGGTTQVFPPLDAGPPDAAADSSISFSGAGVTTRAPVQ